MSGRPHRVIYTHGGGRFGNQLLRFLHWAAWARTTATDVEVLNLAFWPYARYFRVWREHPGCVYPARPSRVDGLARIVGRNARLCATWGGRQRLQRTVHAAGRWVPGWQAIDRDVAREEGVDLDDPAVLACIRDRHVTTCSGWKISSWGAVAAQAEELRTLFEPVPEANQMAQEFIAALRQRHDLVVGVLIRQSDYREWHGGRFFFETSDYAEWMQQLLARERGRSVAFVVASEEHQDPDLLAGLPWQFASGSANAGGHWFASWMELAHCDLIMSAPSTFSATAAFVGNVPLWPLVSRDQQLDPVQLIRNGLFGAAHHREFSLAVK